MKLYPHNANTYQFLQKAYEEGIKQFAIVQATGTGKSALVVKYIEEYFLQKRILYLAPRKAILSAFQNKYSFFDTRIEYKTYSGFCYKQTDMFDLVILDELHRVGAEKWNKEVSKLLERDRFVIGLTATPKRHLDKNKDMAKILFGSHIIYGPSLAEAVEQGILPKFTYITALFKKEEIIREYKRKINPNTKLYEKARKLEIETPTLKEIFYKHGKEIEGNQKWLIFCPNIKAIDTLRDTIKDCFDFLEEKSFYCVDSKKSEKRNEKSIKDFIECKKNGFLFCVDMLNEGVHIEGITGVIMLRQTESANVFLQQLGRGLSAAGKKERIYVFDLVGNHSNLVKHHDLKEEFGKKRGAEKELSIYKDILVYDYTQDMTDFMNKIDSVLCNTWTKEEENLLIEWYPKVTKKELLFYLKGKTAYSIKKRAKQLGLVQERSTKKENKFDTVKSDLELTEKEIQLLLYFYALQGKHIPQLKDCKKEKINHFINSHAISKPCSWTKEQQQYLLNHYYTGGILSAKFTKGHTSSANMLRLIELNIIVEEGMTQSELLAKIKEERETGRRG